MGSEPLMKSFLRVTPNNVQYIGHYWDYLLNSRVGTYCSLFYSLYPLLFSLIGTNMATRNPIPIPVARVLRKLGNDIRDARRRRRIPTEVMAERAAVSRTTLMKAEQGDSGVSIGTIATLLFILGLHDRLAELADVGHDQIGLDLADELLPQRIRRKRCK